MTGVPRNDPLRVDGGGFFLIQHVEFEQDGQRIKGMELIGP